MLGKIKNFKQQCSSSNVVTSLPISRSAKLFGMCSATLLVSGHQLYRNRVHCQANKQSSRILEEKLPSESQFDWKRFWQLLKPHSWYLIVAVAVS